MIRIARGPEPQTVIDAREEKLSGTLLAGGAPDPDRIVGYGVARPTLWERQFAKCAYCESWAQQEAQPVEHFRPKGRPSRIDWTGLREHRDYALKGIDEERFTRGLPPSELDRVRWPDPREQPTPEPGYWWLAWTWENLVFGCQSCNGGSRKGSRFPLMNESPTLALRQQPPGDEQALLLDPMDPRTDPMDVIRFRWDGKHWRPFPVNDDPRAAWTIAVLGLDGPSLLTLYTAHVKAREQMARAFKGALAADVPAASIGSAWNELCESALDPGQPFLALTHDWLGETFQNAIQHHGLTLRRPSLCHPTALGTTAPQPPLPLRAELNGLSESLKYRIRVVRHTQPRGEVLRALLVDICRERPSTTQELKDLVGRPTALDGHLAALQGSELACDPATGCWSPVQGT